MKSLIIENDAKLKEIIDKIDAEITENMEKTFDIVLEFLNKLYTIISEKKPIYETYPLFEVMNEEIHLIWKKDYHKSVVKVSSNFGNNILYNIFIRNIHKKGFFTLDMIDEKHEFIKSIIDM